MAVSRLFPVPLKGLRVTCIFYAGFKEKAEQIFKHHPNTCICVVLWLSCEYIDTSKSTKISQRDPD